MNLKEIIEEYGTYTGEAVPIEIGTPVEATEGEIFCYSVGDVGILRHYDSDGDAWVEFGGNPERVWAVTGNRGRFAGKLLVKAI